MSLSDLLLPSKGRLIPGDVELLSRVAPHLPAGFRVGHLHPSRSEHRALAGFEAITVRSWDLQRRRAPHHPVLVAGRLPAFGDETEVRFRNALHSCALLVVLDARESSKPHPRLLASVGVGSSRIRLYRGDFSDPLLRVDDYPSGVRPILNDLSSIHDVLSRIDESGLAFHLGVVPAILEQRMVPFLRGLQHLIVSMHGFEHGHAKHSKILLDAGDPSNQRGTVSGFDEFAGQSYERIFEQLQRGRQILETRLGQLPASYIPPCNESNRHTGRALVACGFEYVLTEKRLPGGELPVIGSDFYDRSSAFESELSPNVASLHVTWEADLLRSGDSQSLAALLAALVEQRARTRQQLSICATRIAHELNRA